MRVLVTGGTGFVGRPLCEALAAAGFTVRVAVRNSLPLPRGVSESVSVGDICSRTEWGAALEGVDIVVHAAARAHVLRDSASNDDSYIETNARGTARLASESVRAGVGRLVFLSSIKVNGEGSDRPYRATDEPQPRDAYGRSKLMAELSLREVAGSRMETVIVRPPLVYGTGVKANFLRLLGRVHQGRTLPLGKVNNVRSLVSVWNLSDFLAEVCRHPRAAGTWLVSDGQDLSTPELVAHIAKAMGRSARLLPVPVSLLTLAGTVLGKGAEVRRLCGSLAVDSSPARNELGWTPPLTFEQSLVRTVEWYLAKRHA